MNPVPRRQKIEAMLAEEPGDVFLRYSLALEMAKEGELEQAVDVLRELTTDAPQPYVPAFFMAGQLLAKHGRIQESRAVLRDGIEHARGQGEHHAAGEMSEFLATLGKDTP